MVLPSSSYSSRRNSAALKLPPRPASPSFAKHLDRANSYTHGPSQGESGNGGGILPTWLKGGKAENGDSEKAMNGKNVAEAGGRSSFGVWWSRARYILSSRLLPLPILLLITFFFGLILPRPHLSHLPFLSSSSSTSHSALPSSSSTNNIPFLIQPESFPPPPEYKKNEIWPDLAKDLAPESPSALSFFYGRKNKNKNKNKNKVKETLVPNVVHYIYGLKEPPASTRNDRYHHHPFGEEDDLQDEEQATPMGPVFPYYAYLGIRSVMINQAPERIYFHYLHLPTGPWFDLLLPFLTLNPLKDSDIPREVMGRKVGHFAHWSDLLRLDVLLNTGGIYLDIDMFVLQPLTPLFNHPTTLGMEASPDSRRTELEPEGLCNALIIAQPHSSFLERWKATYEDFEEGEWAEHSVAKPWALARQYPSEIQVLSTRSFFWPLWSGDEIKDLHEKDDYDFAATGQFAYHAWESLAMKYLSELSPMNIKRVNTSFHRMVRPYVGETDEEVYHRIHKKAEEIAE